ncbi:MAG: FHA domain-containing protein [Nitrococcus mobilis]|nr:FHA domain-containing protein [Nitrococcus mobilis]
MMEENETSTQVFNVCALLRGDGTAANTAQLIVIHGRGVGQKTELNRPRTTIGRRDTNHLILASATVSREHAYVTCEEDRYSIVDIGSRNGVYVNGQKIPPRREWRLSHGDSLALGEQLLLFHCPQRLFNSQGLVEIGIDRNKVKQEVDDLLARFLGSDGGIQRRLVETDKRTTR